MFEGIEEPMILERRETQRDEFDIWPHFLLTQSYEVENVSKKWRLSFCYLQGQEKKPEWGWESKHLQERGALIFFFLKKGFQLRPSKSKSEVNQS